MKRHTLHINLLCRPVIANGRNQIPISKKKRVFTNAIKNIDSKGIIINNEPNTKEVVYNIKVKLDRLSSKEVNYKASQDNSTNSGMNNNVLTDFVYQEMNEKRIIQRRLLSESLCDIKKDDQAKIGYSHHYYLLSGYDMIKSKILFNNTNYNNSMYDNTKASESNMLSSRYQSATNIFPSKTNYFLRKDSIEKQKFYLVDKIKKNAKRKGLRLNDATLNNAFISPRQTSYPLQFLPGSKSGLLHFPRRSFQQIKNNN